MNLNTQQLRYLLEIDRIRSISQAADNLYLGQPNLSRMLRDMENDVGFAIFERTHKGVRPTKKGTILLQHAKNILRESELIEKLGAGNVPANRLRIGIPRSHRYFACVIEFLRDCFTYEKLDVEIRECHPQKALELLDSGSIDIAVIRYCVEYQDYFSEQAQQRELIMLPLSIVEYQILVSSKCALSMKERIAEAELKNYVEIKHRDSFYPANQMEAAYPQIHTVDRMAQLQLLQTMPDCFIWSEPLSETVLLAENLVQKPCKEGGALYQEALVYKSKCTMSAAEQDFISWISSIRNIWE